MDLDNFNEDLNSCAVYLYDLNCEDANIRYHAVTRVKSVAQILGKDHFIKDMITKIPEIIDKNEFEEEFLIQMTNQLFETLSMFDENNFHILYGLMEKLAHSEDPNVRNNAIEKIRLISSHQNKEFFIKILYGAIKRLSTNLSFQSKIIIASLIPLSYPFINDQEKNELRIMISDFASEYNPFVRRSVANTLKSLILLVEKHTIKQEIIPLINSLMKDEVDSVKINAIENWRIILEGNFEIDINESLIHIIRILDTDFKSWRVRYALGEILYEFSKQLEAALIRDQIYPLFEGMLKDSEPELKILSIKNMTRLLHKLDIPQRNSLIINFKTLSEDPSMHVRMTVSALIPTLCEYITPQQVSEDILSIFEKFLDDEMKDVRISAINKLHLICDKMESAGKIKEIFIIIEKNIKCQNWSNRLGMVEALLNLIEKLGFEKYRNELIELLFCTLNDHYFAIRDATIRNIKKFFMNHSYQEYHEEFCLEMERLITQKNYLFRITYLILLSEVSDIIPTNVFKEYFDQAIEKSRSDSVANVRIKLVQIIDKLVNQIDQDYLKQKILPVLQNFLDDCDTDVVFYTNLCLSNHSSLFE